MTKNPRRQVWLISDTHFGHAGIMRHCRPQFSSVEEMDEHMIERWCATVGPTDLVYHLGDFAWRASHAEAIRPRLTGTIRLVVGNHDDIPRLTAARLFQRVEMWRVLPEFGVLLSHVPMRGEQLRYVQHNAHGHVHGNTRGLSAWHRDFSVESTDYTPVSAWDVREWVRATPGCGAEHSVGARPGSAPRTGEQPA